MPCDSYHNNCHNTPDEIRPGKYIANLFKTCISFSILCILMVTCEEVSDKQDIENEDTTPADSVSEDTLSHPLIGRWVYHSGRTELFLTSDTTQTSIDYSQKIQGSIDVSGSQEVSFRHFTSDLLFWSDIPNYLLTTDFPWNFPRKELRLYDTSETKTAELSVSGQHYFSDSIDWVYNNLTGALHLPPSQLYTDNRGDSVTINGDASVPMLILEAGIPALVIYLDTINIEEPLPEIALLGSDSMLIWDDTYQDSAALGAWYALNDSLCVILNGDSATYGYSILGDTLSLMSPKMMITRFGLYEVYGDLKPNTIVDGWDLIHKKYVRKYD